jgi:LemA protein
VIWIIVAVAVVGLVVISGVLSYNWFLRQRNLVQESWRQIDVELHRRYDLVPSLVETGQAHAAHERGIFEEVARLRNAAGAGAAGLADRARQESALAGGLRQLFAVVENYPVLKSDQTFLGLQQQLAETEDRIAAGRRFYNANARAYNTRVEAFPSNLVASQFRFAKAEYFEVEEAEVRAAPAIEFGGTGGANGDAGGAEGGAGKVERDAGRGQTAGPGAPGPPPQLGPGASTGSAPGEQS